MKRSILLLVMLAAGCAAPHGAGGGPPATADDLIAADRSFALATAERGLEGWMSYFDADAARLFPGRVVRGLEEIRAFDSELFEDPTLSLKWDPVDGGLFRDADHGFTTGRYELIKKEGDGAEPTVISRGTYVTVWRRGDSGWKVILDTGSADPPAEDTDAE